MTLCSSPMPNPQRRSGVPRHITPLFVRGSAILDRILTSSRSVRGVPWRGVPSRAVHGRGRRPSRPYGTLTVLLVPVCVGIRRASGTRSSKRARKRPCLVTTEIHHPDQVLGPAFAVATGLVETWYQMCSSTPGAAPLSTRVSSRSLLRVAAQWRPHGAPRRTPLMSQAGHRAVLTTELVDGPPARPRRQQRPGGAARPSCCSVNDVAGQSPPRSATSVCARSTGLGRPKQGTSMSVSTHLRIKRSQSVFHTPPPQV